MSIRHFKDHFYYTALRRGRVNRNNKNREIGSTGVQRTHLPNAGPVGSRVSRALALVS